MEKDEEENKLTKEELDGFMETLGESMENAHKEKVNKVFGDWIPKLLEANSYMDITNPEMFATVSVLNFDRMEDRLAKYALQKLDVTPNHKNYYKLLYVFIEYKKIERHLKSIYVKYEGGSCQTDKSRWLISAYTNYLITEVMPVRDEDESISYTQTKKGSMNEWMSFIEAIPLMVHGTNVDDYLKARLLLEKAYADEDLSVC